MGESTCAASCGSIAVSEVIPLAKPGTLMRAPGWLLDPTGPLTLWDGSALPMLPWFLRFANSSRLSRIKTISSEISALTSSALTDTKALLKSYQLSDMLRDTPVIELYDSEEDLQHEFAFHKIHRDLGFQIVVAAGAWIKALVADIGLRLQLEGVIGYQKSFESHGLNATPNWNRADVLVEKARRVLPDLCTSNAKKRIGRRPLMPDTKPIIGRVSKLANFIIATGHGQLGLTLGATTARLVADIVALRKPSINLTAYRPERF
jgi:hypothetical protein